MNFTGSNVLRITSRLMVIENILGLWNMFRLSGQCKLFTAIWGVEQSCFVTHSCVWAIAHIKLTGFFPFLHSEIRAAIFCVTELNRA